MNRMPNGIWKVEAFAGYPLPQEWSPNAASVGLEGGYARVLYKGGGDKWA